MTAIGFKAGRKKFLHNYKLPVLPGCVLVGCRVKDISLFAEILSDSKVAVFGDYDLILCYRCDSGNEKEGYRTKLMKKTFCEVVACEGSAEDRGPGDQGREVTVKLETGPFCKTGLVVNGLWKSFFNVGVFGEIKVESISRGTKSDVVYQQLGQEFPETWSASESSDDHKDVKLEQANREGEEDKDVQVKPVRTAFYIHEMGRFVRLESRQDVLRESIKGEEEKSPVISEKENKPVVEETVTEFQRPIKTWQFEVKDETPITNLLDMDLASLQETNEFPVSETRDEDGRDPVEEKVPDKVAELEAGNGVNDPDEPKPREIKNGQEAGETAEAMTGNRQESSLREQAEDLPNNSEFKQDLP